MSTDHVVGLRSHKGRIMERNVKGSRAYGDQAGDQIRATSNRNGSSARGEEYQVTVAICPQ